MVGHKSSSGRDMMFFFAAGFKLSVSFRRFLVLLFFVLLFFEAGFARSMEDGVGCVVAVLLLVPIAANGQMREEERGDEGIEGRGTRGGKHRRCGWSQMKRRRRGGRHRFRIEVVGVP
jgi:hypothetical protein